MGRHTEKPNLELTQGGQFASAGSTTAKIKAPATTTAAADMRVFQLYFRATKTREG
jgi:hypothetical protein